MKISIITVSYNSASTIRKTIESMLSQSYNEIEYIVVDGASSDETKSILTDYEPLFEGRMRWISEPDKGMYDAMNKGIAMATGNIIGFLNSDDYYPSHNVLKKVIDHIHTTGCDAVFADLQFVTGQNDKIVRFWKGSPYHPHAFAHGWNPAHPTFFVKKLIYDKYGTFDTGFDISADFELMLRFIEKEQIQTSYIPEILVNMRYGGASTCLSGILTGNRNIIKAFRKNNIPVNPLNYIFRRMLPKLLQFCFNKSGICH